MRGIQQRTHRLAVAFLVVAALGAGLARAEVETLRRRVAAALAELNKTGSPTVGLHAVDLRTGRVLLDVNADRPLVPASNQKLLTAAFALGRLGRDFQFTTNVYRLGDDVAVVGEGDPTLGDPVLAEAADETIYDELDRWVAAIRRHVGPEIAGDLVLGVSWAAGASRHPDWPQGQRHRWYAAPPASLNFNDNCLDVALAITDGKVVPRVRPRVTPLTVTGGVTLGAKQTWSARLNEDDSVLTLAGSLPRRGGNRSASVAVNNPPLLLGRALAERLAHGGVTLAGDVRLANRASMDWNNAEAITRTTTPLAVVLERANKRSLNLAAECLFLRAGDGSWAGSAALMTRMLREIYGLDVTGLVVRDGGGLSRGNRVRPRMMVDLLRAVLRRSDAAMFLQSLPVSGKEGTLKRRLTSPPYRGRVLGKTGYISRVSALSGYVLDEAGEPAIAFAILVNDTPSSWRAKQFQDTVCRLLVDWLPGETK